MTPVPTDLRRAIEHGRCLLFIGAGASMDALDANGTPLPSWRCLLLELLQKIQETAEPDPQDTVDEIRATLDNGDYMAVSEWINFRLGQAHFHRHLMQRLLTAKSSRVHDILSSKPFKAVLTTNYDQLPNLHWTLRGKTPIDVVPKDSGTIGRAMDAMKLGGATIPIIRAHGSLSDPSTLIFFPKSYRDIMFRNEEFRQFMSMVFRQFTVLFVGTSFRDPNLQSLLQWIYSATDGQENPHYAILDRVGPVFRRHMMANYNIDFITYSAPSGDHSNLRPLLESL